MIHARGWTARQADAEDAGRLDLYRSTAPITMRMSLAGYYYYYYGQRWVGGGLQYGPDQVTAVSSEVTKQTSAPLLMEMGGSAAAAFSASRPGAQPGGAGPGPAGGAGSSSSGGSGGGATRPGGGAMPDALTQDSLLAAHDQDAPCTPP